MDQDTRFLSPPAVARILGVSPDKILKWIADGALRAVNVSSADRPRWRIDPEDARSFLRNRSNQTRLTRRRRRRDVPPPGKSYV